MDWIHKQTVRQTNSIERQIWFLKLLLTATGTKMKCSCKILLVLSTAHMMRSSGLQNYKVEHSN